MSHTVLIYKYVDPYSLLIAGDDSTVNAIINMLLKRIQFDSGLVLQDKEELCPLPVRVGIIPCGGSSTIAHTVHGASDMTTAVLHILYGEEGLFFCN